MSFKDHFSGVATSYAAFRPEYPEALFHWLASISSGHDLAWDCACGSGQASRPLTPHFNLVVASDASAAQVASAEKTENVSYVVAPATPSPFAENVVDLVTVAQALHWFVGDTFFAEVRRVLRRRGVFAAWTYGMPHVGSTTVEDTIHRFIDDPLGPYWPPEIRLVLDGYTSIDLPFIELDPPDFEMMVEWKLGDFLGHARTWSATGRFIEDCGEDPVERLAAELRRDWGADDEVLPITWQLKLRVGSAS